MTRQFQGTGSHVTQSFSHFYACMFVFMCIGFCVLVFVFVNLCLFDQTSEDDCIEPFDSNVDKTDSYR